MYSRVEIHVDCSIHLSSGSRCSEHDVKKFGKLKSILFFNKVYNNGRLWLS